MGFLTGKIKAERGETDDFWFTPIGTPTASGVIVTEESALKNTAVLACVRVLAESVAQLPLMLYEKAPDGGKERAETHPLYNVLHRRPNEFQTSYEFREMMQGHLSLRGNAYALIDWNLAGKVSALIPQNPDRVKPIVKDGKIYYEIESPETVTRTKQVDTIRFDEMFHLRGLSSDGVVGLSPIALARESIGMSLAAEDYGARFFQNDARPPGIIEHPTRFPDDESLKRFRDSFQSAQTGANRHKTAVLEDGMKYHEIAMSNEDAQFLETRKFQVNDIARIFRVPPHMIGDLERATFSNIEHQGLEFVTHTLGPWLQRWEQAINRDLITQPNRYFAEHKVEGLLRGDIASRYSAYAVGVTNGWLTRNEVRKLENLNPLDGLDEPLTPLNMSKGDEASEPESTESDDEGEPEQSDEENAIAQDRATRAREIANYEQFQLRADYTPEKIGAFAKSAREMYSDLSVRIETELGLSETLSLAYCESGRILLKKSEDIGETLQTWADTRFNDLLSLTRAEL